MPSPFKSNYCSARRITHAVINYLAIYQTSFNYQSTVINFLLIAVLAHVGLGLFAFDFKQ